MKIYFSPKFVEYGSAVELTKGSFSGWFKEGFFGTNYYEEW